MSSTPTPDRTAHESREADRIYRVAVSKPSFPTPLTVRERSFPGHARSVAAVRIFVADCLSAECPVVDEAVLCASELATNALLHSASGAVGGDYRVRVEVAAGSLAVSVFDRGPSSVPREWRSPDERGRGLDIVVALAAAYDVVIDGKGRRAWCRLDWPAREETAHRTAAGSSPERKKDPGHFDE